ncbi:hypothetical protein FRB90_002272 [Tulasnella sp. 427]|nr:hypothetical protein FRB90_002272 [Tulasnella sp. 427]
MVSGPPSQNISPLPSDPGETRRAFFRRICTVNATRSTSLSNDSAWTNVGIANSGNTHSWIHKILNQEQDFVVFGEILAYLQGTRLSAKGNVFPANKKLQNGDPVKWSIAVGNASDSTPQYDTVHNKQLAVTHREFGDSSTLYQVRSEASRDNSNEPINMPIEYKHFLRSSDLHGPLDTLLLTTPNIYTTSSNAPKTLPPGLATLPSRLSPHETGGLNTDTSSTSTPATVTLNSTYVPSEVFPDHTGDQFANHNGCRVVQLDFRDINGELVPMADVRRVFRPGTFIQSRVTLNAYDIVDKTGAEPRRVRSHIMRLHSAQVLRESAQEYEPVYVPPTSPTFSPMKRSNDDFDDASPSKKRRDPGSPTTKASSSKTACH